MGVYEYIKVGNTIKELRKSRGITAKDAAKDLNINYSTYSNYENGNREPNLETLRKIADYYDVTLNDMIGFDNGLRLYLKELREKRSSNNGLIINDETDPSLPYNIAMAKLRTGEELTVKDQKALAEHKQEALKKIKEAFRDFGKTLQDLYSVCEELNDDGQKKVLEHAEMIAKIPEYRKGTTENTEE